MAVKAALIWMSILVNIFLSGKKIPMMHSVMKLRFAKSFPVMEYIRGCSIIFKPAKILTDIRLTIFPRIFWETYRPRLESIRVMPAGMKAYGGCGYGIFETAQDLGGL